ncbi:Ku protein [Solitalea longa]|uniref:Non-homologous end joining protein Ku n=1 Tax=Solitalea longa TaxID=2079460 RepID=A0A2S5A1P8_9SPHI|nr:Ku protein [Solitalea longa]POY36444.1 Ku protein [Solitalea longa]
MPSIWSGTISFGLVSIPISLVPATQSSSLELNMLDKRDHERIRYKKVNGETGKEVPEENIVKGYEYDGKRVVLEDADFVAAAPEKSQMIQLENFIDMSEVDPIYFETAYYATTDKKGAKAYRLLTQALEKTGKAGLGRFVLRTAENLCLVVPVNGILVIQKLHFPEEIRPVDKLVQEPVKIEKEELNTAVSYISQTSKKFDISDYHNMYSRALLKLIEDKAKGKVKDKKKVVETTTTKRSDNLLDLLKQSLNSTQQPRKAAR